MKEEPGQETNGRAAGDTNNANSNNNSGGTPNIKGDSAAKNRNRGKQQQNRTRSRSPVDRGQNARGRVSGGGDGKAAKRVYVANIAFDVKWSDIKDLFREKIGNVVYAQLFEDEQGRSRGCGLVEFNDVASAKKAIEVLNRFNFRNRELVVKEDLDCERDRYGRLILPSARKPEGDRGVSRDRRDDGLAFRGEPTPAGPGGPVGYGSQPVAWNTYGLSTQFLDSLGIECPLNNRIFVANLDYKVGEKKLEEIFRLAGKVLRVKLYTDSTGSSKGHGTVEFDHPVEAVQAISMFHDQKLYGRPMSIRMDKYETEETPEVLPSKLPAGLEGVGKGLGIGGQPLNVSKSLLGQNAPPVALPAPVTPAVGSGMAPPMGHSNVPPQAAADPLANINLASIDTRALSSLVNSTGLGGALGNVLASVQGSRAQIPQQHPAQQPNMSMYSTYEADFRRDVPPALDKYPPPPIRSDTVVVRNLPPNFNWQALRNRFAEMGDISYAELKAPGTALIRFHTDRSAQRAVDLLHGLRFENRAIEVNFY